MADSQVNRGILGMQRRTWGTLVALTIVLLLGAIFYFYPRTLEVRGGSLGSTFTADAQLIVKDKIDQTVVQVVPVSKVVVNMKSGYTISYSPSWFEFPRRLSVDVCFNRASVLPTTTTLPEHVYCQKPVEKVAYMCDDHNVWTQYFSTTQVADLRAYCGETKPSATAPATPVVAGEKSDAAPVTNYYTTTGGTNTTVNNEIDMPECDSDEILVWDNDQWNCRDQATVVPVTTTYPSCAPGEVLTSVAGVLGCTPVAAAAYPNCAANETLTSTAGVLSCTPDYVWTANSNIGAAIPVADGGVVKFTSSNGTIVTTSAPGDILNFDVQVDSSTPNNALVINGALGLYVPAGLTSAITSINGQTGPAVTFDSTGPISTTTTANTVTYGLTACANGEVYQMVAGSWTCVSNGVVNADNGLSLSGTTVQLGGPVGAAGAAALLSNREIPTAGFDTAFSGTGRIAVGTNTIPAIGGAGPGNVFITSNSGNGTFYSARYENPGADDTGLKVFSNTNAIVARFGFYPGFAGNYALAVADQGDMMFGTNAAGGTTRFLAAGAERMFLSPQGNLSIGNNFTALAKLHVQGGTTGAAGTAGLLMEGVAAQPALSIANAGKVYFDSTLDKFRCSENTGAYFDCFNPTTVASVNAGLGLINVGTASAVDLDVRARSGVSLQGDFVHLGDPTAGPAAAPLLYDTNINYGGNTLQLAGTNTVFSASTSGLRPQGLSFNTNVQINGSGSEGIWFTDNSSGAGYGSFMYQENLGAGSMNMGTFNGGPYRFYTNNTERARFSGSGQFGIGNTNPLAILDVAGAGAGGDAGIQWRGVATAPAVSTASAGRVFYNSTTNTFQCSRNGGVYADCMGADANNWLITGNAGTTAGTNFLGTTDAQALVLKTNSTERLKISSIGEISSNGAVATSSIASAIWRGVDNVNRLAQWENASGTVSFRVGQNYFAADSWNYDSVGQTKSIVNQGAVGGVQLNVNSFNTYSGSGNMDLMKVMNTSGVGSGYYPISGSGQFNGINLNYRINQTGTANGISRGLYINPIILAAVDHRALEVDNGNVILNTTSGSTGIGTVTPNNKLEISSGTTTASGASGLRFTNLTSSSATSSSNGKLLTVNSSGDVILADVAASLSANNGLTLNGSNTVQLGGNLIQNTTISGTASNYSLSLTNTSINLDNSTTSGSVGVINMGGSRFLHNYGTQNTFLGSTAGNFTTTNTLGNVGIGQSVLSALTTGGNNVGVGVNALLLNASGTYNVAIGAASQRSVTTGQGNTATGHQASRGNTTGSFNTSNGYQSLYTLTGDYNTAIGYKSGLNVLTGSNNLALGANTDLPSNTGSNQMNIANTIFGIGLTGTSTSPAGNIGINTTSPGNTLEIKSTAASTSGLRFTNLTSSSATSSSNGKLLTVNSSGDVILADVAASLSANNGLTIATNTVQLGGNLIQNTTINGTSTYGLAFSNMKSLTASTEEFAVNLDGAKFIYNVDGDPTNGINANTFYGYRAGESFASTSLGSANTVVGTKAGRMLNGSYASSSSNAFFGYGAGESMPSGTLNTLLGVVAGGNVTAPGITGMVGIGHHALINNSGSNVIGIGRNALQDNTQSDIIGIGLYALKSNTGVGNVGIGQYTQQNNTIGTKNTTLGWGTMQNFIAGQAGITSNVAIGYGAMGTGAGGGAAGGGYNTVVGTEAGKAMLLGNSNTLLGNNSGNGLTHGSYNVFLGNNAGAVGAIVNTGNLNVIIGNGQAGNALSTSTASNEMAIAGAIFGEATYSANPRIGLGKFPNDRSILDLGGSANSLILPKGTTVSQPAVTLEDGMIRFDTDKQNVSMYSSQSGSWLGLYQKTYTQSTTSATGDLLGSFDHTIILDASSNNIVQSVPAALPQYKDWELRYRAKNASTNSITILGATNNISYNGSLVTSIPMYDGEEVNMYSDGILWYATKVTHLTVNNGLTASGTLAELGGNLLHNTAITNNGFNLSILGSLSTTTFASNGNVGIGTAVPNRPLTVMASGGSSTNGIVLVRSGGSPSVSADRRFEVLNDAINGGEINTYDAAGSPITRLRNNADNFVVANDNANFGIGTTGPLNRLHVRQGVLGAFTAQIENYGGGSNSHGLLINAGGNALSGSQMIEFRRPDGTVIGSVNQDTAASVAFNTTSDRRLKENIVDTNLGLDTLMKLQVHDYNYISDSSNTKMQGFIAQELNDVYSQAVTVGGSNAKTNPWQVDYSKLTPLLTKSIQDLEVKKANKNEIADLNANDENFISELSGILDTTSAQKESIEELLATLGTLKLDVAALQDTVKSIVAALDQDQFGQIKIKKGDTKGTVEFADKLTRTPVVNVTPHDFVSKGYAIKNITDRGFEIRLQEEQDEDVTFDWRAVAAREVEYNTSSTGGSTDSTPADDEESDGEEETPVVEEEVTPTEETPVVEEETPTTDEGGSDTGETPAEEPAIPSGI